MLHHVKILVVDDDQDDQVIFKEALRGIDAVNAEVIPVYNGQEMLDYFLGNGDYDKTPDELPNLIILDISMPVMDGFKAFEELQKLPEISKIPVFVVSGTLLDEDIEKCHQVGCAGIYVKPIKIADVQEILNEMIAFLK